MSDSLVCFNLPDPTIIYGSWGELSSLNISLYASWLEKLPSEVPLHRGVSSYVEDDDLEILAMSLWMLSWMIKEMESKAQVSLRPKRSLTKRESSPCLSGLWMSPLRGPRPVQLLAYVRAVAPLTGVQTIFLLYKYTPFCKADLLAEPKDFLKMSFLWASDWSLYSYLWTLHAHNWSFSRRNLQFNLGSKKGRPLGVFCKIETRDTKISWKDKIVLLIKGWTKKDKNTL